MKKPLLQILAGLFLTFSMISIVFAVKTLGIGYFLAAGFCTTVFIDVHRAYCRTD